MGEDFGAWTGESELDEWAGSYTVARDRNSTDPAERPADITLRPAQGTVYHDDHRFRVLVAGRRFGKSYLAIPELLRWARGRWKDGSDREAWYVAPTLKQAKRDLWRPLKRLAKPFLAKINETTTSVELIGGGRITLLGAENYDSLRGAGLNGLVLDEYADIAPAAWQEALRPLLADRQGAALFIGTPEGFNHFYELYSEAVTGVRPDWTAFHYTTIEGGNVPPEEIESARRDLDPKVFAQEFEASFESLYKGRAYYDFDRRLNVAPVTFDSKLPVFWALDFNVNPMASVIGQVSGQEVRALEEIVLPDSNTPAACRVFLDRIVKYLQILRGGHFAPVPLNLKVYGDPAGNARSRAGADKSDWQIVKDHLKTRGDLIVTYHVPAAHPSVKGRVSSVNARINNDTGDRRLVIDPKCKELIADLEQVAWKVDSAGGTTGELDKSNPKRTHISDALGYLVAKEFPIKSAGGGNTQDIGGW